MTWAAAECFSAPPVNQSAVSFHEVIEGCPVVLEKRASIPLPGGEVGSGPWQQPPPIAGVLVDLSWIGADLGGFVVGTPLLLPSLLLEESRGCGNADSWTVEELYCADPPRDAFCGGTDRAERDFTRHVEIGETANNTELARRIEGEGRENPSAWALQRALVAIDWARRHGRARVDSSGNVTRLAPPF